LGDLGKVCAIRLPKDTEQRGNSKFFVKSSLQNRKGEGTESYSHCWDIPTSFSVNSYMGLIPCESHPQVSHLTEDDRKRQETWTQRWAIPKQPCAGRRTNLQSETI